MRRALIFLLLAAPVWAQQYDTSGNLKTKAAQGAGTNDATLYWNTRLTDGTNYFGTVGNPIFATVSDGAGALNVIVDSGSITANAGTNLNTSSLFLDATFTGRMPAGASPADNESNTNTALSRIGTFNFVFDGSTWDRMPGTSVDGVLVNLGANNDVTIPTNSSVNVAQRGAVAVVAGACERETLLYIQISQTGNTQLITGTASERIYICYIQLMTATAQNIALVDGTGAVCVTSPTGLLGGSTAATGWNFAANGGIVLPPTRDSYAKTSTDADNVCLLQSGAGQVSGSLAYISIPNI